ncbi:unnamed protein product [Rotaria socialis]|uniref:Uncharacterized protein n=1 Tax=Rotaria socialis TaxID=392032 RepID=A0A817YLL6_9BILA|nr:unnamed protein product [Rotaria socialis]CAF3362789.1 unnamed protein product [Rotaria socialis]CAF3380098.1 unnamed protein product [Rotaria socialis]CAF3580875.1 unnamed protein product [Rotaria socialis]CAF3717821.1 unnamed protein product [Rotaria socialis]
MEYATSPQRIYRKISSREKNSSVPSLVLHINNSDIVSTLANDCTYRTEAYLQEREKQNVVKPSTSSSTTTTTTTWKKLKYQKEILDNEQAEIDRVLSAFDSIHRTFNRSLSKPYNQVYSSLYGDDNQSDRLMKTFFQCQNHCTNVQDAAAAADTSTQETLSSTSILNFNDTDSDLDDIEDKKKNSYDSGYGSVMPRRRISRESFAQISNHLNSTMNSIT